MCKVRQKRTFFIFPPPFTRLALEPRQGSALWVLIPIIPKFAQKKQRGGDSNPWWNCSHTTFPRLHLKPLGHLSLPVCIDSITSKKTPQYYITVFFVILKMFISLSYLSVPEANRRFLSVTPVFWEVLMKVQIHQFHRHL